MVCQITAGSLPLSAIGALHVIASALPRLGYYRPYHTVAASRSTGEHDPEVGTDFPQDKREAFARRSCSSNTAATPPSLLQCGKPCHTGPPITVPPKGSTHVNALAHQPPQIAHAN